MFSRDWIRRLPSYLHHGVGPFDGRLVLSYLTSIAIVACAHFIRWSFDAMLPPGLPFLTFFPAVIIAAFCLGPWPAILASVTGMLLSWYYFIPPFHSFALNASVGLALGLYLAVVIADILLTYVAIGAIVDSDRANKAREELMEFQEILIKELDHRIKNLFSVMSSLVKLSARYADTPGELAEDVSARIMALGRSQSALWRLDQAADATVQSVARQILEPFLESHASRITIAGQSPVLDIRIVQILSLIFHELATNAAKYGALLNAGGQVKISSSADGSGTVTVIWSESAIADLQDAERKGFGSELIDRLINSVGGTVDRTFEDDRMATTLRFSAS